MEILLNILVVVGLCWLCFRLGQASVIVPLRQLLEGVARERGQSLEALLDRQIAALEDPAATHSTPTGQTLRVEQVGGQYYAWSPQGEFLAQGSSPQELQSKLGDQWLWPQEVR